MTLRDLAAVTLCEITFTSTEDTRAPWVNLTDYLRGCSGIMGLEIAKLGAFSDGSHAVYIDLPPSVIRAIHKDNEQFYSK